MSREIGDKAVGLFFSKHILFPKCRNSLSRDPSGVRFVHSRVGRPIGVLGQSRKHVLLRDLTGALERKRSSSVWKVMHSPGHTYPAFMPFFCASQKILDGEAW